jgi:hypothetical protein
VFQFFMAALLHLRDEMRRQRDILGLLPCPDVVDFHRRARVPEPPRHISNQLSDHLCPILLPPVRSSLLPRRESAILTKIYLVANTHHLRPHCR